MSELLTVKEAAALLKTSRVQIRKMIQGGELLAVKVGREYRIPLESIWLWHFSCGMRKSQLNYIYKYGILIL